LKLLGHRYYDSSTGRFLTRDPIKDGRNWFSYCENNPVSFYDSEGLAPTTLVIMGSSYPPLWPVIIVGAVIFLVVAGIYYLVKTPPAEPKSEPTSGTRTQLPKTMDPTSTDSAPSGGPSDQPGNDRGSSSPLVYPGSPNEDGSHWVSRVVGEREEAAIRYRGGRLGYGGTYDIGTSFWTHYSDAERYKERTKDIPGFGQSIWGWRIKPGTGYPGPPMDNSNFPTWTIPISQFPLVGPGVKFR
jgi:uncharacterized protein RhaS with RHS repeats